jgi:CrcB protein
MAEVVGLAVASAHLVGVGGALGALLRHLVAERLDVEAAPLGTVAVNVLGSFALGLLVFGDSGGDAVLFLGTGAAGSFTTYSSFSYQTVRLFETGERRRAAGNAVGTLLAAGGALAAAWLLVGG